MERTTIVAVVATITVAVLIAVSIHWAYMPPPSPPSPTPPRYVDMPLPPPVTGSTQIAAIIQCDDKCRLHVETRTCGETKGLYSDIIIEKGVGMVTIPCNGTPTFVRFWPSGVPVTLAALEMGTTDLLKHATIYTMPTIFSPNPPRSYFQPEEGSFTVHPAHSLTIEINEKIHGCDIPLAP